MRSAIAWIALLPIAAAVAACAERLSPPTPPLLQGAVASSGWAGGCPPHANELAFASPEAHAVQVETRLNRDFPAGTPETTLMSALARQGFKPEAACDNDPTIHRAQFNQAGGGLFGPYPALANIAWKVDGAGRIVWTKADLMFTGP
jgi:hypothetical protein